MGGREITWNLIKKYWGIDVEQVYHATLLGVTISHDLSWNKHVENIVKQAGKIVYMLYQLKGAASPT